LGHFAHGFALQTKQRRFVLVIVLIVIAMGCGQRGKEQAAQDEQNEPLKESVQREISFGTSSLTLLEESHRLPVFRPLH